ncbi:MAG: LOG family protein [Pseudomonadota bacterium]|nr:LOG family protein [Pseudomonadota bacterium]
MKSLKQIFSSRGVGLSRQEQKPVPKKRKVKAKIGKVASAFINQNNQGTTRVFVAGGSRSGRSKIYEDEAFRLGQEIGRHHYRLDFGLSSKGIMGAVARGVLNAWGREKHKSQKTPIHAVTTKEYLALYENDEVLSEVSDIIVAHTLEERKQQLLNADFVIFTPGGVGTLDELAYDCVAMQDGFLNFKPFVLYNISGFFHHLLEYLKDMNLKGFSDPMPFIVVDDSLEAGIAFEMIGRYYRKGMDKKEARETVEKIIHDLPYVIDQKVKYPDKPVIWILDDKDRAMESPLSDSRQKLENEIEKAYLDKEIERMYNRLAKSGRDTAMVSYKLTSLKLRSHHQSEDHS